MSVSKRSIVVSRDYRPEPDNCVRALELLLKTSVRKEAAHPAAPDNVKESNGYVATEKYNA
jgi:hypothetical protein